MLIPYFVRKQVGEGIRELEFFAKRYGRTLFESHQREEILHDMEIVRVMGDLDALGVELIGQGDILLASHKVKFSPNGHANRKVFDPGRGLRRPIIPADIVVKHEFVCWYATTDRKALYRHLLKINWSTAKTRPKDGTTLPSAATERNSWGWLTGETFVSKAARRRGLVVQVVPDKYALARDELAGVKVKLDQSEAPAGFKFQTDHFVHYVLVEGPPDPVTGTKRYRGRDIGPA